MKICETHWGQLKQAIKSRGLWDLVSKDVAEVKLKTGETLETFDPLLEAHNIIAKNALNTGEMYFRVDEKGEHCCPICEAGHPEWIENAAQDALESAKKFK